MRMISLATAIERVRQQLIPVILVYKSHERWPLSPTNLIPTPASPLHISVLDSSFNPPTLAHRALISSPSPFSSTPDYNAKLLLLSVYNADKSIKPGDATLVQRLEMMILLAQDQNHIPNNTPNHPNIAVAITDQPTFIGKSSVLRNFLRSHLSVLMPNPHHEIRSQLSFLVGFDTLERIFCPRYYSSEQDMYHSLRVFLSEEGDDSFLVCARRPGLTPIGSEKETSVLKAAKEFVDSQRLALIDIEPSVNALSSSQLRQQIAMGDSMWKDTTSAAVAQYIEALNLYLNLR